MYLKNNFSKFFPHVFSDNDTTSCFVVISCLQCNADRKLVSNAVLEKIFFFKLLEKISGSQTVQHTVCYMYGVLEDKNIGLLC